MSATPQHRSSSKSGRQSLFYRDLASPVSAYRAGRFSTPLWRDGLIAASASDPPPPPVFTLDDRPDLSPEPELPPPPSPTPSPHSPPPTRPLSSPSSSFKIRGERIGSAVVDGGAQVSPRSASWWSPARAGDGEKEKERGSPVDGVVQTGALLALPPPKEVVRPEAERGSVPPVGGGLDEAWVTVFGFSPGDTNLILREFEKCGVILKHVPGPRDSNWMHILYENHYDAQKALGKSGMQINNVLIIGAKPVDPMHRRYLEEKPNGSQKGFMVSLPRKSAPSPIGISPRPYYLQGSSTTSTDSERHARGAIATPSKSVVAKVMDLMFGI